MVLEIYDREAMGEVTAREIAIINQGLIEEFGEGGALPPAEIARILSDEELPVRFEQVFNMGSLDERYERIFEGALAIDTLDEAEVSIRGIDSIYRRFLRRGDKRGARYARHLVLGGKRLAMERSVDPSLAERERDEQSEIAQWLTIWLQTPDLFDEWLELRRMSADYRDRFGATQK